MKFKNLLAVIILSITTNVILAQESDSTDAVQGPFIEFKEKLKRFGEIKQGDKVEHTFAFVNAGNEPLIISNVLTTCGCTAPSWPKEPIEPGDESSIVVRFNSAGKMGRQNKVITVISNAHNNPERVKIQANVLPPEERVGG